MKKEQLEKIIAKANFDYYTKGESELDDSDYDNFVEQLRTVDPENSLLKHVGDEKGSETNKVKLPLIMGSQEKIRIGDADLSTVFGNAPIVQMAKLDGLSMLIEYDEDGNYSRLYTRGDGTYGQDITYRGQLMNFPKHIKSPLKNKTGKTYICGEAVVSVENYKKVKGTYKHRRNFVGGTLRPVLSDADYKKASKDVLYNCGLIDIVVWEVPYNEQSNFKSLSESLTYCRDSGFIVTDYHKTFASNLSDSVLEAYIKSLKNENLYEYLCDGAVFKIDNCKDFLEAGLEANGLNPKGSRAVKLPLEKQTVRTGVIGHISWDMSKRGLLKPVVWFKEGLDFDGVTVNKVNGVSAKYVEDGDWGKSAEVLVIRSGDVIPRIISTVKKSFESPVPSVCPYCGQPLKNTGVDIYCDNENCHGRNEEQVVSFFTEMKLDGVGEDTIRDLFEHGFDTPEKLVTISYDDVLKLDGYQAKKAFTVSSALNNSLKKISLAQLMQYSQCFHNEKHGLGLKRCEQIVECLTEKAILSNLNNEVDENGEKIKLAINKLLSVDGLGEKIVELFKTGYSKFKQLYLTLKPYIEFESKKRLTGKLLGMQFCFTQFRDKDLETLIINNGGEVGSLTKKTSVLFFAGNSTKLEKAKKYGTKTVPQPEAWDYIKSII